MNPIRNRTTSVVGASRSAHARRACPVFRPGIESEDELEPNTVKNMQSPQTPEPTVAPQTAPGLPPGNHPLEIAARRGIGPLSHMANEVWHGNAQPCVSCGQLVTRGAGRCYSCDQDLSERMLRKMRAHAGPWYVLEHVRPFPGVSLDRIVRQIRRGVLTETSIVRGPATDYQWRFAAETPGLCRYFGRCWRCHEEVGPSDVQCRSCQSPLAFGSQPPSQEGSTASGSATAPVALQSTGASGGQLLALTAAVESTCVPTHDPVWEAPPRVGRFPVAWVTTVLLLVVIIALIGFSRMRDRDTASNATKGPRAPVPTTILPSATTEQPRHEPLNRTDVPVTDEQRSPADAARSSKASLTLK